MLPDDDEEDHEDEADGDRDKENKKGGHPQVIAFSHLFIYK